MTQQQQMIIVSKTKQDDTALLYLPAKSAVWDALQQNPILDWIAREIGVSQSLQSDLSRRDYLASIRRFLEYNSYQIPTVRTVESYLELLKRNGLSLRYRRRELAALRWLASRLLLVIAERNDLSEQTRKYIYDNAQRVADLPDPKGYIPKAGEVGHLISQDEFLALLETCKRDASLAGKRDLALFTLAGFTGLRIGDTANILYDEVRRGKNGKITISVLTKGDKMRHLPPISGTAAEYLSAWMEARGTIPGYLFCPIWQKNGKEHLIPSTDKSGQKFLRKLSREALRLILRRRFVEAGIFHEGSTTLHNGRIMSRRGSTWHDFRRSLVSRLLADGVDLAMVARYVDHSLPNTTARYDIRPPDEIEEIASRLMK